MILKYGFDIDNEAIKINLGRLTNQIYKLLPLREEGCNWQKPLETLMEELAGMDRLFIHRQPDLYKLACKLEGLFSLDAQADFMIYRGVIFECLGIIGELQKWI